MCLSHALTQHLPAAPLPYHWPPSSSSSSGVLCGLSNDKFLSGWPFGDAQGGNATIQLVLLLLLLLADPAARPSVADLLEHPWCCVGKLSGAEMLQCNDVLEAKQLADPTPAEVSLCPGPSCIPTNNQTQAPPSGLQR